MRRYVIDASHAAARVGLACSGHEGFDDLAYCSSRGAGFRQVDFLFPSALLERTTPTCLEVLMGRVPNRRRRPREMGPHTMLIM
ncbi:uncharacterized protein LOC144728976 isoform X2 [Lampetra planeri]